MTSHTYVQIKIDKYSGAYNFHLTHEYSYTEAGLPESRKTLRWNPETGRWQNEAIITYTYDGFLQDITLEYAVWNSDEMKFDVPTEKAVYQVMANKLVSSYTAYSKDNSDANWAIKEHFSVDDQFIAQAIR